MKQAAQLKNIKRESGSKPGFSLCVDAQTGGFKIQLNKEVRA